MLTADTIAKLQTAAQTSRDPYVVAQAAGALLAASAGDTAASGHYVGALTALKLIAASHEFLRTPTPPGAQGFIPWSSRARRFAANLKALAARTQAGAALVEAAAGELTHYELHQCADSNFQVLDRRQPVHAAWLGGLANHQASTSLWQFDRGKNPMPLPIAFDGIGHGWVLLRVLETTERTFLNYSCAIYILEPDPPALAMLFHMHDFQQVIGWERIRWIIGPSADVVSADFRATLESHPQWPLPDKFVRAPLRKRPMINLEPLVMEIQAGRERRRKALISAIEQYYGGKDAAFWDNRFESALSGQGEPLRVLGITSRFTTVLQYSMAELKSAVESLAADPAAPLPCRIQISIEPDDQAVEHPFLQDIADFKPDLLVQISRMRYENPQLPRGVPFLTWDQDNLPCMRMPQATASLDDLTFVAGQGALQGYAYLNWPERNIILCHLAAATHRYAPREPSANELSRYGCDFSYLSNAAAAPSVLRDQHLQRFGGNAPAVFSAVTDHIIASPLDPEKNPWHDGSIRVLINRIAEEKKITLPPPTLQEMVIAGLLVADRAFRHQTLQWVSDYCQAAGRALKIYGAGWESHPTLARHAAGPAQPGEQLQAITLATRINLQIIGTGVLHARLLDGLAAGGFFMYRQTHHDRGERKFLKALETVSRYVFEHPVQSLAAIDAITDERVRTAWAMVGESYQKQRRDTGIDEICLVRGIASAHQLQHPLLLLPSLGEVAFETPEQLGRRAERFLSDDSNRRIIAADLRGSIQQHFSYDVRWRKFLGHIRAHLKQAGPPAA